MPNVPPATIFRVMTTLVLHELSFPARALTARSSGVRCITRARDAAWVRE